MKEVNWFVYLVVLILITPLVSAADILVGGKAYPLIIVAPLVLVIFVWIIILFIYLKRNINKLSLLVYNLRKLFRRLGLEEWSEKLKGLKFFKKKEEKKKEKIDEVTIVKDLSPHLEALKELENHLPRLKVDEAFNQFNDLMKKFFADLLGMHYQYTDEELVHELQKKKRSLVKFAKDIAELKYSGKEITKDNLMNRFIQYNKIVQEYTEKSKSNKGDETLVKKIIREDKKVFENIKTYVNFLKTENRKNQIKGLLDQEKSILKDHIRNVKKTYNQILKLYIQLSPNDRAKIYPQLMEFYNDVNQAIFSSVYEEKSRNELQKISKELEKMKRLPRKEPFAFKIRRTLQILFPDKKEIKHRLKLPAIPKVKIQKKKSLFTKIFKPKEKEVKDTTFERMKKQVKVVKPIEEKPYVFPYKKKENKKNEAIIKLKKEERSLITKLKNIVSKDKEVAQQLEVQKQDKAFRTKVIKEQENRLKTTKNISVLKRDESVFTSRTEPIIEEIPIPKHTEVVGNGAEEIKEVIKEPKEKSLTNKQKERLKAIAKKEKEKLQKIDAKEREKQNKLSKSFIDRVKKIKLLLKQGNIKRSKEMYSKLKPMFTDLNEPNQKKVYPELNKLQTALEDEVKTQMIDDLEVEEKDLLKKMEKLNKN